MTSRGIVGVFGASCEKLVSECGYRADFQTFPAQDDARHGPSGFLAKLFHPERDSFPWHPTQFVQRVLAKNKLSTGKGRRTGALGSEAR